MLGDVDLAATGALLADPARARILVALLGGEHLPAGELARRAGISASGASNHLAKLLRAGLVDVRVSGRRRLYRLGAPEVAAALEALGRIAPPTRARTLRAAEQRRALERARTCYDHLAGRLGVSIMQALIAEGAVTGGDGLHHVDGEDRLSAPGRDVDYRLSRAGAARLERLGIEAAADRPLRYCVDWTEQAHHLSGPLGRALADRLLELGWLRRADRGRAVHVTDAGADGLQREFRLSVR